MPKYIEQMPVMETYNRFPITLEKGEGVYVYDNEGKKYLDMCAGIAVNTLGHAHPVLIDALTSQMKKLIHTSNLYHIPSQIEAASQLVKDTHFSKVFFCNSGAEANEAALKLAKKYGKQMAKTKTNIIAMDHSFHGRTIGALAATGQEKYQKAFTPLLQGFSYADYNDISSLESLIDDSTCAVILEVIQGEGGIIPADKAYLQKVQQLCEKYQALLIVDEVQTGIGRTGKLFAYEHFGIKPDVVTMAKGLGGGVPIGAMMCTERADVFKPGDHASTFGGNPLATTAAKTILSCVKQPSFLENVQEVGNYLQEKLLELKNTYTEIVDVRGIGLMQGIELSIPAKEIIKGCIAKGMLVVGAGEKVIRFVPPLIITKSQIEESMKILDAVLQENK